MSFVSARNLLECFRNSCLKKGWKAGRDGDWVRKGGQYYAFIWSHWISAPTFDAITRGSSYSLKENGNWQVRKVKHMVFISERGFQQDILHYFAEDPGLSKRASLYDIATSEKLREVRSEILLEFEKCLEKELGLKFSPIKPSVT